MASHHGIATTGVTAGANGAVIKQYLMSLGERLRGPSRARTVILEEIRTQLEDATETLTSRGLTAPAAADLAISDLGSPAGVASMFAGELAILQARRVLWALLLTGPLVGIWWLLLLAPTPWNSQFGILIAAIPVLPLIAAAVGTAVVAIAATGSLIRWVPEVAPRRALSAAIAVLLACIAGDLTVLTILLVRVQSSTSEGFPVALAAAAAAASGIRLLASAWAIRQCIRVMRPLIKTDTWTSTDIDMGRRR